jgi:RNA 2',3'-cyclic 3'-phosphodiesterase
MRLFVGLALPWGLREAAAGLAHGLNGARWVPPENLHLTLRFLGEVSNPVAEEVDHALAALRGRGFALALGGVGVFERNGRPATLWAGVVRAPGLEHLQSKIETAIQRAGLPAERRRFQPHVTLARVENVAPERLAAWIAANNLFRTDEAPVGHFTLFSSQLGRDQAVYTPEVEYALA